MISPQRACCPDQPCDFCINLESVLSEAPDLSKNGTSNSGPAEISRMRILNALRQTNPENGHVGVDSGDITPALSRQIARFADANTNQEAAEFFDVSVRTVERHRATWNPGSTDGDQVAFESRAWVNEELCAEMRELAADGLSLREIGDEVGVGKRTAHQHVSAVEDCQHDVDVPRVELDGRYVTPNECDEMRRKARAGMSGTAIAERVGRTRDTVNRHVSAARDCACDNNEPAIEYG